MNILRINFVKYIVLVFVDILSQFPYFILKVISADDKRVERSGSVGRALDWGSKGC